MRGHDLHQTTTTSTTTPPPPAPSQSYHTRHLTTSYSPQDSPHSLKITIIAVRQVRRSPIAPQSPDRRASNPGTRLHHILLSILLFPENGIPNPTHPHPPLTTLPSPTTPLKTSPETRAHYCSLFTSKPHPIPTFTIVLYSVWRLQYSPHSPAEYPHLTGPTPSPETTLYTQALTYSGKAPSERNSPCNTHHKSLSLRI